MNSFPLIIRESQLKMRDFSVYILISTILLYFRIPFTLIYLQIKN